MTIDILTIFPEMFENVLNNSILGRARAQGLITIDVTDIRPFSTLKHKNTDDYPFGGGAGMLMLAQPIADAIRAVCAKRNLVCSDNAKLKSGLITNSETEVEKEKTDSLERSGQIARQEGNDEADCDLIPPEKRPKRIYLSPRGIPFTQRIAEELAQEAHLILLCGHYEGVDQRVLDKYIDMEVSIGDYVLTGGELGAMVMADCIARLIPGVLGSEESSQDESFSQEGLLEYPQYTRPRVFEGMEVPSVLLNGDHAKIAVWRREQAILTTLARRPDMLKTAPLTKQERAKYLPNGENNPNK